MYYECEYPNALFSKAEPLEVMKRWNAKVGPWLAEAPTLDGSCEVVTCVKILDLHQQLAESSTSSKGATGAPKDARRHRPSLGKDRRKGIGMMVEKNSKKDPRELKIMESEKEFRQQGLVEGRLTET